MNGRHSNWIAILFAYSVKKVSRSRAVLTISSLASNNSCADASFREVLSYSFRIRSRIWCNVYANSYFVSERFSTLIHVLRNQPSIGANNLMDDYSLVAALALNTQFKPQQDAQIAICIYSPLTGLVHSHLSSRPAFLYYDHLLTLDEEIKFIWSRPYHSSSWLFFLNRYFSFVGNIVIFLSMFFAPSGPSSCHPWEQFQQFFHASVQIIVAILLTMRVYALYGCNRHVAVVLSGIIVFGVCATAVSLTFSKSSIATSPFPIGCHDTLNLKNAACSFNSVVSVGWELVLFYDTLLFSMTLLKAYQARFQPRIKEFNKLSLLRIIVQDGSIYFGIMVLTNFTNVLTFYISGHISYSHVTFDAAPAQDCQQSDTIAQTANPFTPDATVSAISFGPRDVSSLQES
ncbi:hypothetical protein C8R42DRAFT_640926 [Lentinula raphanica]|nr:hypothetical protein C8R42DRAFT_640926 [Lentinula raphanica]